MTQKEFTERTKVAVSAEEYAAIETVYMNSDLEKDEFCKAWCRMNASRVRKAKAQEEISKKDEAAMDIVWDLYNRLQQTGANLRPEFAADFLTEKERKALMRFGIGVWNEGWGCEKDTTDIFYEISKLIDEKAA